MARTTFILIFGLILASLCALKADNFGGVFDTEIRKAPRLHLPFFGIGPKCNGCPPRSCEDDPAIVYGYCCGCARYFDKLPVLCPKGLDCPLNGAGLCHDYEYMMLCCC